MQKSSSKSALVFKGQPSNNVKSSASQEKSFLMEKFTAGEERFPQLPARLQGRDAAKDSSSLHFIL